MLMLIFIFPHQSHSHSGRTNSYGCHTNHSNSVYHCHESKGNRGDKKLTTRNSASVKMPKELINDHRKKKNKK